MAKDPIVFAMANPTPEIMPEIAAPYVRVMATGRSDYPNQINNVLAFPGIFKGALACRATQISEAMKVAAAQAIAACIADDELNEDYIIPSVFNRRVAPAVAEKVIEVAQAEGLARRVPQVGERARGVERDAEEPLAPTTGWVAEHAARYVATDGATATSGGASRRSCSPPAAGAAASCGAPR